MRGLSVALFTVLLACPSQDTLPPTVELRPVASAQPVASAPAAPVVAAADELPPAIRCTQADLGPKIANPRTGPADVVPVAGQMTEECAKAIRLYNAEKWDDAVAALGAVASGQSGDDEGNKQIAAYRKATALYRLKRLPESYAAFDVIARNRGHIKHTETLLWLSKLIIDQPGLVDVASFATYTKDDVDRFHNVEQSDIWSVLLYWVGRERLQEGAKADAAELFSGVVKAGRYMPYAQQCLDRALQK